ncbi:MAG: NAD kinase [Sphingomonadaceae bacterium]
MKGDERYALVASPTVAAQSAVEKLRKQHEWVNPDDADIVIALGGDGFLLQTLHEMLDRHRIRPVFGMNLGTVGFLMNEWQPDRLFQRISEAKRFQVSPLRMEAETMEGQVVTSAALNEVSLLRETRQTARLEVTVDGRIAMPELVCDGVLVATPAGSTAYNFSAQGPILPLDSALVALTPISPFRPRRWRGAILPDRTNISFRVLDPRKRPVSAVADQREVREVTRVSVAIDKATPLTLLFDPEHALDDRIAMEQFAN